MLVQLYPYHPFPIYTIMHDFTSGFASRQWHFETKQNRIQPAEAVLLEHKFVIAQHAGFGEYWLNIVATATLKNVYETPTEEHTKQGNHCEALWQWE